MYGKFSVTDCFTGREEVTLMFCLLNAIIKLLIVETTHPENVRIEQTPNRTA